jgi:hypothetical protein
MVEVDGIVEVDGVDENVRDPRLPTLKPPPGRASAADASSPAVAATIAKTARARKTLWNMKSSHCVSQARPHAAARRIDRAIDNIGMLGRNDKRW